MKLKYFVSLAVILCIAAVFAGCTQSGTTTTATTTTPVVCPTVSVCTCPTADIGPEALAKVAPAGSLTVEPTQTLPPANMVNITVGWKDIYGKIPVVFDGGQGQNSVKDITVVLTRVDGTTQTATLQPDNDATVVMDGTTSEGPQTTAFDRVQVYVNLYTGVSYKVADVLRPYRERG